MSDPERGSFFASRSEPVGRTGARATPYKGAAHAEQHPYLERARGEQDITLAAGESAARLGVRRAEPSARQTPTQRGPGGVLLREHRW